MNFKAAFSVCLCFFLFVAHGFAQEDNAGKQKLLNDLRNKAVKLQAEHGVAPDLTQAENICLDPNTTITDCRRTIRAVEKGFATEVKQKEAAAEEQTSNTVIINQGGYVHGRRPGRPGGGRPVRPVPLPQ